MSLVKIEHYDLKIKCFFIFVYFIIKGIKKIYYIIILFINYFNIIYISIINLLL